MEQEKVVPESWIKMKESSIERKLVSDVRKRHGMAPKFVSPGLDGMPDRLILLPGRRVAFVETKAPDKKLRPLQLLRKVQLETLGFKVYCVDGTEQVGGVLDEIQTT